MSVVGKDNQYIFAKELQHWHSPSSLHGKWVLQISRCTEHRHCNLEVVSSKTMHIILGVVEDPLLIESPALCSAKLSFVSDPTPLWIFYLALCLVKAMVKASVCWFLCCAAPSPPQVSWVCKHPSFSQVDLLPCHGYCSILTLKQRTQFGILLSLRGTLTTQMSKLWPVRDRLPQSFRLQSSSTWIGSVDELKGTICGLGLALLAMLLTEDPVYHGSAHTRACWGKMILYHIGFEESIPTWVILVKVNHHVFPVAFSPGDSDHLKQCSQAPGMCIVICMWRAIYN